MIWHIEGITFGICGPTAVGFSVPASKAISCFGEGIIVRQHRYYLTLIISSVRVSKNSYSAVGIISYREEINRYIKADIESPSIESQRNAKGVG